MAKEKPKKPMSMEQARKMVAGQFKSKSAIGRALRELMAGGPGVEQTTITRGEISPPAVQKGPENPYAHPEDPSLENPDTNEERRFLGIPPRPDPENEDTEGW